MTPKERDNYISEKEKELYEYWAGITINDIVSIKTKPVNTMYVQREAEEFLALKLPLRSMPGEVNCIRCIRLDQESPRTSILSLDRVQSIDGKDLNIKKEWKVKDYTVRRV